MQGGSQIRRTDFETSREIQQRLGLLLDAGVGFAACLLLQLAIRDVANDSLHGRLAIENNLHALRFGPDQRAVETAQPHFPGLCFRAVLEHPTRALTKDLAIVLGDEGHDRVARECIDRRCTENRRRGLVAEQQILAPMDEHRLGQ